MENDFMTNLNNMMKNGKLPKEMQDMINNLKNSNNENSNFTNSNETNNSSDNFENTNTINNENSGVNPEMLKNIMNMFNSSNSSSNSNNSNTQNNSEASSPNIDINMLLKIKSIMDNMNANKNDPRSNLLRSLKPYLKKSRQDKVEQYVQLFSMGKIINAFNSNGGENVK